jgi:hypothetical protein
MMRENKYCAFSIKKFTTKKIEKTFAKKDSFFFSCKVNKKWCYLDDVELVFDGIIGPAREVGANLGPLVTLGSLRVSVGVRH